MLPRAAGRAQAGPAGIVSLAQIACLEVGLEDLGVEGLAGGVSRFETPPRQRPERLLHPRSRPIGRIPRESGFDSKPTFVTLGHFSCMPVSTPIRGACCLRRRAT